MSLSAELAKGEKAPLLCDSYHHGGEQMTAHVDLEKGSKGPSKKTSARADRQSRDRDSATIVPGWICLGALCWALAIVLATIITSLILTYVGAGSDSMVNGMQAKLQKLEQKVDHLASKDLQRRDASAQLVTSPPFPLRPDTSVHSSGEPTGSELDPCLEYVVALYSKSDMTPDEEIRGRTRRKRQLAAVLGDGDARTTKNPFDLLRENEPVEKRRRAHKQAREDVTRQKSKGEQQDDRMMPPHTEAIDDQTAVGIEERSVENGPHVRGLPPMLTVTLPDYSGHTPQPARKRTSDTGNTGPRGRRSPRGGSRVVNPIPDGPLVPGVPSLSAPDTTETDHCACGDPPPLPSIWTYVADHAEPTRDPLWGERRPLMNPIASGPVVPSVSAPEPTTEPVRGGKIPKAARETTSDTANSEPRRRRSPHRGLRATNPIPNGPIVPSPIHDTPPDRSSDRHQELETPSPSEQVYDLIGRSPMRGPRVTSTVHGMTLRVFRTEGPVPTTA